MLLALLYLLYNLFGVDIQIKMSYNVNIPIVDNYLYKYHDEVGIDTNYYYVVKYNSAKLKRIKKLNWTKQIEYDNKKLTNYIWWAVIVLLIIYGIIYKYNSKKKIKLVDKNDYDTVEKYYKSCIFDKLNKDNEEYDLYDAFETVWDNCREFLNMHKKCIPKNELFLKEDIEQIKKINSKNLNKIYEETNKVLDIIYKYYTEDGIRKMKEWSLNMKRMFLVILILLMSCGCSNYRMNEIPEGYIDKDEHYQQNGFQDYTDYAKYVYSDAKIIKNNSNYKEVTNDDIIKIQKYFDETYTWLEKENRSNEFDFDNSCINQGDYVRIIDKYENDSNTTNYSIYFFDIETLTLYYVHSNS